MTGLVLSAAVHPSKPCNAPCFQTRLYTPPTAVWLPGVRLAWVQRTGSMPEALMRQCSVRCPMTDTETCT